MIKSRRGKFVVIIRSGDMEFQIGDPVSSQLDAQRILRGALTAFGRI